MRYKFSDLYYDDTKNAKKLKSSEYKNVGKHIIVDQGKALIAGYTDNEDGLYTDVPAIIFGDHTRNIKYIDSPFFLGADGTKVLKSSLKNVNYKYLYYLLKNASIPDTGYNRHFKWLKELIFKYHSQEQQNQIVTILDKLDLTITKYREELSLLEELAKARFVEMFGDPVENTMNWPEIFIGDKCFVTKLAGFEYTQYIDYEESGEVVMVKAQNVKNGKLNRKDLSFISKKVSDSLPRSQLAPGDVVMTYVGANIGDVAVIDDVYKYHLAPNVAKIRPNNEFCISQYLLRALISDEVYNQALAKNNASTVAHVNVKDVKNFMIPVPPLELQNQFASFVEEIDKSRLRELLAIKQIKLLLHDSWFLFY